MIKRIAAGVLGLAVIFGMSACSADGLSDPAFQTLRYEGGDTGGSKFKECVEEGEKLVSNDRFYAYPKTQREAVWDSANFEQGAGSADYPDLVVTDKDGRPVHVKMKVSFFLNTSCEPVEANGKKYPGGTIQAYHELIGKTRVAYFDTTKDGKESYSDGWLWAMTNYLGTPVEDYVTRFVRSEKVENLHSSTAKQDELKKGLSEALPQLVNDVMETDLQFYQNFTVSVSRVQPDPEYLSLLKEREDAQIKAETAQKNAESKVAEAKANAEVAREEAKIQQAKIQGYGGFDNYKCIYLADKGLNCAQPQYVVGGNNAR